MNICDPGWLYIAVSDRYRGKAKIGPDNRAPSIRAGELTASGYCLSWHEDGGTWYMVYAVPVPDCVSAIRRAHLMWADKRVAWAREIFAVDLDKAGRVVEARKDYTGQGRGVYPRSRPWRSRWRRPEQRF